MDRWVFLRVFVRARVDAEHAGSFLGPVWLLATPLLNCLLYFIVFGMLLGARHNVPDYPLFLMTGVLLYTFFSRSVNNAMKSLSRQRDFVRTIPFPRMLLPLAAVGMETHHLTWSLGVLAVVAGISVGVHPTWLFTLAAVGCLLAMTTGVALLLARVHTSVPDTGGLLPFAIRAGSYLSGVYFPLTLVTGNAPVLANVLAWNPISLALTAARDGFAGQSTGLPTWGVLVGSSVGLLAGGVVVFWRGEPGYGRG